MKEKLPMVAAEQFENPVSIMLLDKSLKIGQPSVSRFHICFSNVKTVAFTEFFQFLFSLKKKKKQAQSMKEMFSFSKSFYLLLHQKEKKEKTKKQKMTVTTSC